MRRRRETKPRNRAVLYPENFSFRSTGEDCEKLERLTEHFDLDRGYLLRLVLREFLARHNDILAEPQADVAKAA